MLKVWVSILFGGAFLALIAVLLFLLRTRHPQDSVPATGPRQTEARPEPRDYSTSNSVSVILGEQEAGAGIRHIASERDGLTAIGSVEGVTCRYLDFEPESKQRAVGYFYFAVDPSFKQADIQKVTVEIEYRSDNRGSLGLDYDGSIKEKSLHAAYLHAESVNMTPSKSWQTASFSLEDAGFQNSQNGKADFRLWVRPPSLYVRRVTLTKEPK